MFLSVRMKLQSFVLIGYECNDVLFSSQIHLFFILFYFNSLLFVILTHFFTIVMQSRIA